MNKITTIPAISYLALTLLTPTTKSIIIIIIIISVVAVEWFAMGHQIIAVMLESRAFSVIINRS